jgi:hypothetical protein
MVALAFSALCGLAMAVLLHVNYVMPKWRTHESAILYLDSSAAWAGFTGRVRGTCDRERASPMRSNRSPNEP